MDLGCFDMGCIETEKKEASPEISESRSTSTSSSDSVMATSKIGKNKALKESGQSNWSTLNKCTVQIRKPPHRKTSPLNWFPRKKVDSYLKRKIKLLQEVDGMNSTLDETLGDSNPHYSRVLKEKIAVKEAASKAIEARKAAMVEASWCRILKAARLDCKGAEDQLFEAEKIAAEAFEAATAIGVTMYDIPGCPQKHYEIETTAAKGGASTTHTVSASFETAFEVDKQVACAVKAALTKLANCPSIKKDDFRELLRKISQNPDSDENFKDFSEFSSECESDTGSDFEVGLHSNGCASQNYICEKEISGVRQRKYKKRQQSEKFSMSNLVELMLERLKGLHEDELTSLATIVATCGLNAALAEVESSKKHNLDCASDYDSNLHARGRTSISGAKSSISKASMDGRMRTNMAETELPSLDKFLVKRLTRLEREVLEAKNARINEAKEGNKQKLDNKSDAERLYSLDNRSSDHKNPNSESNLQRTPSTAETELPGLDKFLVKRLTRLEREVLEAKNARLNEAKVGNKQKLYNRSDDDKLSSLDKTSSDHKTSSMFDQEMEEEAKKKSGEMFKEDGKNFTKDTSVSDLGTILVKHSSKLEKEIEEARRNELCSTTKSKKLDRTCNQKSDATDLPSLDNFLVKHMSRLEKEVQEAKNRRKILPLEGGKVTESRKAISLTSVRDDDPPVGKEDIDLNKNVVGEDELNRKRETSLKAAEKLPSENENNGSKEAGSCQREDILQESSHRIHRNIQKQHAGNGGNGATEFESLDKVLVKHVSKMERAKMEFCAKEETMMNVKWGDANKELRNEGDKGSSLDQVLVKHKSRLEREKMAAAAASTEQSEDDDQIRHSVARREARQKELQEAWGGLSLGNSMRPHLSRLQRDKAAWLKAEEEERRRAMETS
ncbi:hypothetical protein ACH5RR_022255 [Cinchona calisaya]|uniref:Uncharacterized protein n=1 Tax=Cinchona calisaya TaxID=153742 RepID=A0ABD2Z7B0_9GENT